jgi:hypothetical protein
MGNHRRMSNTTQENTAAFHPCTINFEGDESWKKGIEYDIHINIMSDLRLQVFKTAKHFKDKGISLRIYKKLEHVFSDFNFSESEMSEILGNHDHIMKFKGKMA